MMIKNKRKVIKKFINNSTNISNTKFIDKANNKDSIRVLYKKTGQPPKVRVIDNVYKLKKAIVEKRLDIIPYEKLYIICSKRKAISNVNANIVLTFRSIYGDIILVDIDKKEREFKSLSQEDLIWYSQDLINKSSITIKNNTKKKVTEFNECNFEKSSTNKSNNFEEILINVLMNIEVILSTLLRNGDKK